MILISRLAWQPIGDVSFLRPTAELSSHFVTTFGQQVPGGANAASTLREFFRFCNSGL
jgi:hypothetical protein